MISEALRLVRLAHGYKAKDVAQKLDISSSYLSEIESGKKNPTLDLLKKYSDEFDIKLSTLMFFSEELDRNVTKERLKDNIRHYIFKLMQLIEKQNNEVVDK